MRRLLKGLAVLAVLLAGAVTAVVIHRLQAEKDIHGSSTEFVPTPPKATPLPRNIAWPEYGFEGTRTRAVNLALRPPYRREWTYHAGSLVEFPPVIAYGRLYFSTNSGKFVAVNAKTGSARGSTSRTAVSRRRLRSARSSTGRSTPSSSTGRPAIASRRGTAR